MMQGYVFREDYLSAGSRMCPGPGQGESVSVRRYKRYFFSCLERMARVTVMETLIGQSLLEGLLKEPNAVLIVTNRFFGGKRWGRVRHRLLRLSLGSHLLPQHLLAARRLPKAQVELVSTQFQRDRMRAFLGKDAPRMEVFPPPVDTEFFRIPGARERSAGRRAWGVRSTQRHLVYAGRLLPSKGVLQFLRCAQWYGPAEWVITIAGDDAQQGGFAQWLAREARDFPGAGRIRVHPSLGREDLRALFWSADACVCPSVHEDENFGIAVREAMACGVAPVVTEFAGLAPVAAAFPAGRVRTYPTRHGVRFSLSDLARAMRGALRVSAAEAHLFRQFVRREQSAAPGGLRRALSYLSRVPAESPYPGKRVCSGPGSVMRVQGAFASAGLPPEVAPGSAWAGFFDVRCRDRAREVEERAGAVSRRVRFSEREWSALSGCCRSTGVPARLHFFPDNGQQCRAVRTLVTQGYLVPHDDENACI